MIIFYKLEIFYYFLFTKTLNLSYERRKLAQLNQYPPRKYQRLYGITMFILYKPMKNIVLSLNFYWDRSVSLLFYVRQDTESGQSEM